LLKTYNAAVNIFQMIAQGIFWFHPLVWWANRKIRAEREKCCDEIAIAQLGAKAKEFSKTIVNILTTEHKNTQKIPSLAIVGPVKNIEERIKTMLRPGKKFYKHPNLIATIVIFLLALLIVPTALVLTSRAEETKTGSKGGENADKSLYEAAEAGDIEQVKLLISKGADVNAKNRIGYTPLHHAASGGHSDVVKLLLDCGADINAKGTNQRTPLHYAAEYGDEKTIELLLSKGADINAKDSRNATPLCVAMTSLSDGRREIVDFLVSKGAKVPDFHLASYRGDIAILNKRLQDGVDINSQEDTGSTPLHFAANSGRKEVVEFLIGKGAQVDAKDIISMTPLYYAAMHNDRDIVDLLLAKGADINAKDEGGDYTLLYYAIWEDKIKPVELLIEKGAEVNIKASDGYSPLIYAIWMDNRELVEALIDKGADVNAEDNDGYTPFFWAAMQGSKELVDLLTAKGAAEVSTIHIAAATGDLDKVKGFIDEGTDVNTKDKTGLTALYWSIMANNRDVAEFLIDKGADINIKKRAGSDDSEYGGYPRRLANGGIANR
jgi:ankyrin repeat protein